MKKPELTWYQALGRRKTIMSLAVLVGASLFCFAMSELIQRLYPDRPIVPDILFTLLPDIPVLAFVTDPIMILAIALLLWYMFGRDRSHLPFYFFSVGITYVCRGLLMILTPIGRPTGNLDSYGVAILVNLKQHGMFPSGHVTLAAAIYFLIDGQRHPWFKRAAGLLGLAEMITLILSRGHYSIDVAGGVMLGFIAIGLLTRYRERFRLAGDGSFFRKRSVARSLGVQHQQAGPRAGRAQGHEPDSTPAGHANKTQSTPEGTA